MGAKERKSAERGDVGTSRRSNRTPPTTMAGSNSISRDASIELLNFGNLDKIRQACKALHDYAKRSAGSEAAQAIINDGCVEPLLAAALSHLELTDLVTTITATIKLVASASDAAAKHVAKVGGVRNILSIMRCNSNNSKIVLTSCQILEVIGKYEKSMAVVARLEGGVLTLIDVMKAKSNECELLTSVVGLLGTFCSSDNNTALLIKEGGAPLVMGVLRANLQNMPSLVDESLVVGCLKCLRWMARKEKHANLLVKEEVVPLLISIIGSEASRDVVCGALEVLKHVVCGSNDDVISSVSDAGGLLVIYKVIENQSEDNKLVRAACDVLWRLYRIEYEPLPDSDTTVPLRDADDMEADDAEYPSYRCFPEYYSQIRHSKEELLNPETDGIKVASVKEFKIPPPYHCAFIPDAPEPIHHCPASLKIDYMISDINRFVHPRNVINAIVYDSVDESAVSRSIACPSPGCDPTVVSTAKGGRESPQIFTSVPAENLNSPKPVRKVDASESSATNTASQATPSPRSNTPLNVTPSLQFESRFETGNLRRAIQVYEHEYDLILSEDTNSSRFTQWFYFAVSNTRAGVKYKFNIINFEKSDSLYNEGMLPLLYSTTAAQKSGLGWVRTGDNICYYQNHYQKKLKEKKLPCFTLSFNVEFEFDGDTCYFAYCYPYTYTDLQTYLYNLMSIPGLDQLCRRTLLCSTVGGNRCDVLTITNFNDSIDVVCRRPVVVVTARVHPGESNASWMMKGVLDYLTGESPNAIVMRNKFVFKVIPMLNPDGVINGNYRASLWGCDLNRQWADPVKAKHPTVYYTKELIRQCLQQGRDVIACTDLHGHSRRKCFFMYGCHNSKTSGFKLRERVFPHLLASVAPFFNFDYCGFAIQKSKMSTARIVLWKELGIICSYTLEASFCGPDRGPTNETCFNTNDLESMGAILCDTMRHLDSAEVVRETLTELEAIEMQAKNGPKADGSDEGGSDDGKDDDSTPSKKTKKKKIVKKKASDESSKKKSSTDDKRAVSADKGRKLTKKSSQSNMINAAASLTSATASLTVSIPSTSSSKRTAKKKNLSSN